MPPLVAVVATHLPVGRITKWSRGGHIVRESYVDALRRAGAQPVMVPALDLHTPAAEILGAVSGLLLMGGGDMLPEHYGAEAHSATGDYEPDRDRMEMELAREARLRGTPTLAICRGMQVVNVAYGGTLHQHLPDHPGLLQHVDPGAGGAVMHDVRLAPGSRVAGACGTERVYGASLHHQGIDTVGEGLVPTGWAPDGIVEAFESDERDAWLVAVQWHPEETAADDEANQRLFDALVERAEEARRNTAIVDRRARTMRSGTSRPPRRLRP